MLDGNADPRYNMTDPVVLSPNEVHALAHSADWLVRAMASDNWLRTRQGLSVHIHEAAISYNAATGVYTLVAPPFHQIWIELARQQYLLSAAVLVRVTSEDLDEYARQYLLALYVLVDPDMARAQLTSFLLMRGVSQHRPEHGLIVDAVPRVIERARALASS